jgi:hypothetical protein
MTTTFLFTPPPVAPGIYVRYEAGGFPQPFATVAGDLYGMTVVRSADGTGELPRFTIPLIEASDEGLVVGMRQTDATGQTSGTLLGYVTGSDLGALMKQEPSPGTAKFLVPADPGSAITLTADENGATSFVVLLATAATCALTLVPSSDPTVVSTIDVIFLQDSAGGRKWLLPSNVILSAPAAGTFPPNASPPNSADYLRFVYVPALFGWLTVQQLGL